MTQNIYDNQTFFDGYAQLSRSVNGLDGAPEWPTIRSIQPDLRGKQVVDLGCGYGWFCRNAREQGAARVLGLDLSGKMLNTARAMRFIGRYKAEKCQPMAGLVTPINLRN